jgi:hypothetical protein
MNNTKRHLLWLCALAIGSLVLLMLAAPPMPQPQQYHHFADGRTLVLAIPNTLDVLSNVGLAIAGAAGLLVMRRKREFANSKEKQNAVAFFVGTLLTAIGSTVYHVPPNDGTLVYDRLGMILAFMPFLAMIVHERFDGARWLLPLLIVVGVASVWWWRTFDDLRPYGWVQFFPIAGMLMLVSIEKPRHSREVLTLTIVVASYGIAKLFETFEHQTFALTRGLMSGIRLNICSQQARHFRLRSGSHDEQLL